MFKLKQTLQSRTFWLVVTTFLINGIPAIRTLIAPTLLPYLDLILALLTTATHVFPNQNYFATAPGQTTTVTEVESD